MPSEFFRNQVFVASGLLAQTGGMLVYAMIFYLPLFLQGVMGQTATKAGTSLAPLFLPIAVGEVMGGQVIAKVERYHLLAVIGALILLAGLCPVPDIINTATRRGTGSHGQQTEELYARVQTQGGAGKHAA